MEIKNRKYPVKLKTSRKDDIYRMDCILAMQDDGGCILKIIEMSFSDKINSEYPVLASIL